MITIVNSFRMKNCDKNFAFSQPESAIPSGWQARNDSYKLYGTPTAAAWLVHRPPSGSLTHADLSVTQAETIELENSKIIAYLGVEFRNSLMSTELSCFPLDSKSNLDF